MKKLLMRWNGAMWEWRLMKGMLDRYTVKKFKGKVIEDVEVAKENDELKVGQHYCGKDTREVIDIRNMSGVKRKRKMVNHKRDGSTVEALKAK
jgi:hypothetical protein